MISVILGWSREILIILKRRRSIESSNHGRGEGHTATTIDLQNSQTDCSDCRTPDDGTYNSPPAPIQSDRDWSYSFLLAGVDQKLLWERGRLWGFPAILCGRKSFGDGGQCQECRGFSE